MGRYSPHNRGVVPNFYEQYYGFSDQTSDSSRVRSLYNECAEKLAYAILGRRVTEDFQQSLAQEVQKHGLDIAMVERMAYHIVKDRLDNNSQAEIIRQKKLQRGNIFAAIVITSAIAVTGTLGIMNGIQNGLRYRMPSQQNEKLSEEAQEEAERTGRDTHKKTIGEPFLEH